MRDIINLVSLIRRLRFRMCNDQSRVDPSVCRFRPFSLPLAASQSLFRSRWEPCSPQKSSDAFYLECRADWCCKPDGLLTREQSILIDLMIWANSFFFPLQLSLSLDLKWKSWLDGSIYKGFPALYKQNHPTMILNLARGKEAEDMEYYFTPRNVVL